MPTDETGITHQFVGRLAVGRAALGRLAVGRLALGRAALGRDQGTVIEMGAGT